MSTAPTHPRWNAEAAATDSPAVRGASSSRLKDVPGAKTLREQIRARAIEMAVGFDKGRPLGRRELETAARRLLAELGQGEGYTGWTMVTLASAFWHDQVAAVPCERRLLLLPRCLRDAETCPAEYQASGLQCRDCGGCNLTGLRAEARRLGYHVLIAEGSSAGRSARRSSPGGAATTS